MFEIQYKDDAFEAELHELDARNVLDAIKQEKKEEKAIKSRQRRQRQKLKRKTYQENLERQNEELREQVPSKNVFYINQ